MFTIIKNFQPNNNTKLFYFVEMYLGKYLFFIYNRNINNYFLNTFNRIIIQDYIIL